MSGGFFRGTSADQDTRFSNKQAKLLKSQKFARELEHPVDITKVKMDVVRPWIATRVTELLGFEDEVLINFVYGLLEGKQVDGKQIQIQLTGFMEKNTGKFMKELWGLLLSAQKNASGVPQQFLDAKEEEMKKKKVETDRMAQEIQNRKERGGWGPELDRTNRMDGKVDAQEDRDASKGAPDTVAKQSLIESSSVDPKDEVEADGQHDSRRTKRHSLSPHSNKESPYRRTPSARRSRSRSLSDSRSYSGERHRSRSLSVSPHRKGRSVSRERRYRSPPRRSISPRHPRSPARRQSPHSRKRSVSRSRRSSPPLVRHRSPVRRRSPSPLRRRSPSPFRYRSMSPQRRRSPMGSRRRSPIRIRRRSPSPLHRRSPYRRRHVSPSPLRRGSPPARSPKYRRISPLPSPPKRSRSPPYKSHGSPKKNADSRANRVEPKRSRDDRTSDMSPLHRPDKEAERSDSWRKRHEPVTNKQPISLRSPQRDSRDQRDTHTRGPIKSVVREKSVSPHNGRDKKSRGIRYHSPSLSPPRQFRERNAVTSSPDTSKDKHEENTHARESAARLAVSSRNRSKYSPADTGSKKLPASLSDSEGYSSDKPEGEQLVEGRGRSSSRKMEKDNDKRQVPHLTEDIEYGPGSAEGEKKFSRGLAHDDSKSGVSPKVERQGHEKIHSSLKNGSRSDEKKGINYSDDHSYPHRETATKTKRKVGQGSGDSFDDTDSEEDIRYKSHLAKEKKTKQELHNGPSDDENEYDSQIDDLKEKKRRRKEEKKLRKDEKRRRREERHRKKEERRAAKLKSKYGETMPLPDYEKNHTLADHSDSDSRRNTNLSDKEETESEQKMLEIKLREKALESLRAKKAITN